MINNVNANLTGHLLLANNKQSEKGKNITNTRNSNNTSKNAAKNDQFQISPLAKRFFEGNALQMHVIQSDVPNNPYDAGYIVSTYEPTKEEIAEREKLKAESMAAMAVKEPVSVAFSHRINIGTEENPMWATIRPDKIFISTGDNPNNLTHSVLDFLKGMSGIDDVTSQMLQYTQMLVQGMNSKDKVPTGTLQQVFYEFMQHITHAFGMVYTEVGTDKSVAEDAFRNMVKSMFEGMARAEHTAWNDTELMEQVQKQAQTWADTFLNTFLNDREKFGTETAFLHAWNQIAYMDMTMPWLKPEQSEKE